MPFVTRLNMTESLSVSEAMQLTIEFNLLRAELDDMRAKYAALVALLTAATALGAGYSAGTALAAKQYTPT